MLGVKKGGFLVKTRSALKKKNKIWHLNKKSRRNNIKTADVIAESGILIYNNRAPLTLY